MILVVFSSHGDVNLKERIIILLLHSARENYFIHSRLNVIDKKYVVSIYRNKGTSLKTVILVWHNFNY